MLHLLSPSRISWRHVYALPDGWPDVGCHWREHRSCHAASGAWRCGAGGTGPDSGYHLGRIDGMVRCITPSLVPAGDPGASMTATVTSSTVCVSGSHTMAQAKTRKSPVWRAFSKETNGSGFLG